MKSLAFEEVMHFLLGPELLKIQLISRVFYYEWNIAKYFEVKKRIINHSDRFGSKIMNDTTTIISLKGFLGNKRIGRNLWRGSRDGFTSTVFHELCDKKGMTLTLIKTKRGAVFGGYTDISWS